MGQSKRDRRESGLNSDLKDLDVPEAEESAEQSKRDCFECRLGLEVLDFADKHAGESKKDLFTSGEH